MYLKLIFINFQLRRCWWMKGFKALITGALMALFLTTAACAADTVKIGLLAPLTGFAAADGADMYNSVKLAAQKVNAEGGLLGKKVELICYDDAADPKQAVSLAYKLIGQDKVVGVVAGSYSMPTRAVAPIFNDAKIPMVAAYATHPDVTKGEFNFRNGFVGTVEGRGAAYVAVNLLKGKKIAILNCDNDFGRTQTAGFKDYIKRFSQKTQIVYEQTYPASEKDFTPYLSKIKALNPDVVFASGYYFQTAPMLLQARKMGIKSHFIGEEGSDSYELIKIAGKAAEGFVFVTNLDRDDPRPAAQEYIKMFRKTYKYEPSMVGASGYDAFMELAQAIKDAKSLDPNAIRVALTKLHDYQGATGVIHGFTANRDVIRPVQVQIVKNGMFHHFGIVDDLNLIKP